MKKKRVLIAFLNNGDLKNIVEKELVHKKIIKELEAEGREVYTTIEMLGMKRTTFQDGTSITSCAVDAYLRGERFTHIYADEKLKVSKAFFEKSENFKLYEGENKDWETTGNRLFTYSVDENNVKFKKF